MLRRVRWAQWEPNAWGWAWQSCSLLSGGSRVNTWWIHHCCRSPAGGQIGSNPPWEEDTWHRQENDEPIGSGVWNLYCIALCLCELGLMNILFTGEEGLVSVVINQNVLRSLTKTWTSTIYSSNMRRCSLVYKYRHTHTQSSWCEVQGQLSSSTVYPRVFQTGVQGPLGVHSKVI